MIEEHKDETAPWLKVTAADEHGFRFPNQAHALSYIEQEARKWDWLGSNANDQLPSSEVLSKLASSLSGVDPERPSPVNPEIFEDWLRARVTAYLTFTPALHDRTTLQPYLLRIAERSTDEASWTLAWLLYRRGLLPSLANQPLRKDLFQMVAGMVNAWQWDQPNGVETVPGVLDALMRDAGASTDAIRTSRHQADSYAEALRVLLQNSEAKTAAYLRALEDDMEHRREELQGLHDAAAKKLDDEWRALHRTYDEKLALAAPSKYWAGKQRSHSKLAIRFAGALGAVAVVGMASIAFLSIEVFGGAQINVVPKWSQAVTITAAVVLLVWTLKTLIRLTLSHTHLEIDANERRIMILSYLALLKKSDTSTEQRTALFAAIFRPTGNGLIADEAVPVPLLDLLKNK